MLNSVGNEIIILSKQNIEREITLRLSREFRLLTTMKLSLVTLTLTVLGILGLTGALKQEERWRPARPRDLARY